MGGPRVRRAEASDLTALLGFPADPAAGGVDAARLRTELAEDRMRPEWSWVAEAEDGSLAGRALWWGRADGEAPLTLDCVHVLDGVVDRPGVAAELLRRAHAAFDADGRTRPPPYQLVLPAGWRGDAAVRIAVAWRRDAARAAGLTDEVERLRYEWTPPAGVPPPSARVVVRPGGDEEFLDLFRRVAVDTLDVGTRRALTVLDPHAQARDEHAFYLGCPGDREWWRVAVTPGGLPVGFLVPSATPYGRNVGYLGVVPELRGRGLVDDLLAETTRVHAAAGAERITATTDVTNAPMAAAFDRAGYRVTEVRLVLEAPAAAPV